MRFSVYQHTSQIALQREDAVYFENKSFVLNSGEKSAFNKMYAR